MGQVIAWRVFAAQTLVLYWQAHSLLLTAPWIIHCSLASWHKLLISITGISQRNEQCFTEILISLNHTKKTSQIFRGKFFSGLYQLFSLVLILWNNILVSKKYRCNQWNINVIEIHFSRCTVLFWNRSQTHCPMVFYWSFFRKRNLL